jgi:sec-independent protein translocase protein TatA
MYALGIGPGSIGGWQIAIILLIVLIIFGPKQLPKLAKMFRETASEVRAGIDEVNDGKEGKQEAAPAAATEAPAAPAASQAAADDAPAAAPAPNVEEPKA